MRKLGVIEPGAYADLVLINGDPFADISILSRPGSSLALIMKGGRIYKNSVSAGRSPRALRLFSAPHRGKFLEFLISLGWAEPMRQIRVRLIGNVE